MPDTPGPHDDPPAGEPQRDGRPVEPSAPPPPEPPHAKGFSPEASGAHDTRQPAGIAGAEEPGSQALEFNWGCLALIALLFLVGAIAWFVSGG